MRVASTNALCCLRFSGLLVEHTCSIAASQGAFCYVHLAAHVLDYA